MTMMIKFSTCEKMHQLDFFIFGDEDESNEGVEFVKQIRQRGKLIIQCNDHWGEENNIFNNTDLHNEEMWQKLSVPPKNTANGSPTKEGPPLRMCFTPSINLF